jgi:hypothetical protein
MWNNSPRAYSLVIVGIIFSFLELCLVLKLDFGRTLYWSSLYVPAYLVVILAVTGRLLVRKIIAN